jgi:hypothetical protein
MALELFTVENFTNQLKQTFKDGVESYIYSNSPSLQLLGHQNVSGEDWEWAATYAAAPTASDNAQVTASLAALTGKNAKWKIQQTAKFAAFTMSPVEYYSSKTPEGAFNRVVEMKAFQALEGMKKQMGVNLFGKGDGAFATLPAGFVQVTPATGAVIPLKESETIGLMPGTRFRVYKAGAHGTVVPTVGNPPYIIEEVDNEYITLADTGAGADQSSATGTFDADDVLFFDGAIDSLGNLRAPFGLASWLLNRGDPAAAIAGPVETAYAADLAATFCNQIRSKAPSALGGQYYYAAATDKRFDAILKLYRKCIRAGGDPKQVIINDKDFEKANAEYETLRTQFLEPSTKKGVSATRGTTDAGFNFKSYFLGDVIVDPFCPEGLAYVVDLSKIFIVHMNVPDRVLENSGIANGDIGGQADPMAMQGSEFVRLNNQLCFEDYISISDGTTTMDGDVKRAQFHLYWNIAVLKPATMGVANFALIP